MNKQLFVGNLNFDTTQDALLAELEKYGEITRLEIITDKFSFKSKGFAHVTVDSLETAERIIKALNGKNLDGRPMRVEMYNRK
jgi:RNA recognition motif-containing protein